MRHSMLFIAAAFPMLAGTARAQLMIPDSGAGDRVMLFSDFDGSLIDVNWITDISAPYVFTTPKEARVIGSQIWVSDQVADAVHRFDMARNYLGSITAHPTGGVIDNIRGFGADDSKVYVTSFHATTAKRGVMIYDFTGTPVGFFPASPSTASYFDITGFQNDLLISNDTTDRLERWTTSGTFVSTFASFVAPQQVDRLPDGTIISVSTISTPGVEGVYRHNPDGTLHTYIDTEGLKSQFGEIVPRAAWLLGDGNYIIAGSTGVYKTTQPGPDWGFTRILAGVDAQYINPIPTPGAAVPALLALAFAGSRRRK